MSLPVFNAIGFQRILEKGGHSKPWLVLIYINDSIKPYVVKLYKTADIEARNKMTAEVLGNVLAPEFNLNVPQGAIINFTNEFSLQLNAECQEILTWIDERPKFGSEIIEGSYLYNTQTDRHTINQILEPALLYAFDYFICNRDRNIHKPNLLIKQQESYLIDHEMGLEITNKTVRNFEKGIWNSQYQNHLFYNYLKETKGTKSNIFDEFVLY